MNWCVRDCSVLRVTSTEKRGGNGREQRRYDVNKTAKTGRCGPCSWERSSLFTPLSEVKEKVVVCSLLSYGVRGANMEKIASYIHTRRGRRSRKKKKKKMEGSNHTIRTAEYSGPNLRESTGGD